MDEFDKVKNLYRASFNEHGDSPASLLTPKGRNEIRFSAVDVLMKQGRASICDFGCGLGYLYEYLCKQYPGTKIDYTGVDMLPEFIDRCKEKYTNANFFVINPNEPLERKFDVVFSSGVFNTTSHSKDAESRKYAFERMKHLFEMANDVLVCDFMSCFVDFQQEGAQHFSVSEIADFCVQHLSRKFVIRHDLLPYEFSVIVYKNANILRPENIFE